MCSPIYHIWQILATYHSAQALNFLHLSLCEFNTFYNTWKSRRITSQNWTFLFHWKVWRSPWGWIGAGKLLTRKGGQTGTRARVRLGFFGGQFWSHSVKLGEFGLQWVRMGQNWSQLATISHKALNVQSVTNCVQNWFKPGNIDEGRDRMLSNIHIWLRRVFFFNISQTIWWLWKRKKNYILLWPWHDNPKFCLFNRIYPNGCDIQFSKTLNFHVMCLYGSIWAGFIQFH